MIYQQGRRAPAVGRHFPLVQKLLISLCFTLTIGLTACAQTTPTPASSPAPSPAPNPAPSSNPAPTVSSISPNSGSTSGGTSATIRGSNFISGATVTFDGAAATSVSVVNAATLTLTTPPHVAGAANVTVTNPDAQSATLVATIEPLTNPGFEAGAANWVLKGTGGAFTVQNNGANAHTGSNYAELSVQTASDHPVVYAADGSNAAVYFPVNPGDVINFGGWGYHVSGDGKARWGIEVSDANKGNSTYVSASPYNVTTSSWVNFLSNYTVPAGKAFVRFYCEVAGSTGPAVDRFDDAFLQRVVPGGGFTYALQSNPAPAVGSISPNSGSPAGGTAVTISGSNFVSGATVAFDTSAATGVSVLNSATITLTTPPHVAGPANVMVTNPDGQSAISSAATNPLTNPGFEAGATNWALSGTGGTFAVQNNAANAHTGNNYAELNVQTASDHPVVYAANGSSVPMYFPVNPGDVINFGGWGYHVSGDGKGRWGIEVSDANKANSTYVSASPYNVTTSSWVSFQSSYTVPTGKAFVRIYCEVTGSTGPAVDRFDDALLQRIIPGGGGFTYVAQGSPVINSLSATQGASSGGDMITISGSGFAAGATVTFGGTLATTTVVNSTLLNVLTPAVAAGSVDVTVKNPDGQSATLTSWLHNQGFESGSAYWKAEGTGAVVNVPTITANAHVGTKYLELTASGAGSHPVVYAADVNGNPLYFPVNAGDAVTFGGYAYRVSGSSNVRWGLEVTDANKQNAAYVSAPPYSAFDPIWTTEQGNYTVPTGKSFVRLYAEVSAGSGATVARFDDAVLQKSSGSSSGFTFISPPFVTSVSPNWGAPAGGTTRTVYGTGFRSGATVSFGNIVDSSIQVISANAIEVFAPPQGVGTVNVSVNQGSQTGTLGNAYTYATPPAPPAEMLGLKHIIYTFQENRSFDAYFGKMNEYRQMNGISDNAVDERDNTKAMPDISGQLITPFHFQTECQENTSPSWDSQHYDYDGGAMDNFMKAGNQIGVSTLDPNGTRAIGYFDSTDFPYYYSLAFQFATSDRWFAPMLGPTDSNRMYTYGATSLGWVGSPHPPQGGFPNLTIFDLLDQAGISWKYYYQFAAPLHIPYWSVYQKDPSKFVPISNYFNDVKNESTFPAVVFIEEGEFDEHPKPNPGTNSLTESVQQGSSVIKSFIDALMASPSWTSSAFILSYDEGGGTQDHVVPAQIAMPDGNPPKVTIGKDASGLFNMTGVRVPVVVVSPWTKPHFVSHVVRDHTAILKFIETRFSLPPLTSRDDANDNMTEFFNFNTPSYLTPPTLPAQPTTGVCNLSLEKAPGQ